MSSFSDMLAYLRKRDGMSQKELADKLGISRSTIGMYETGVREPDFETLEALADAFNLNMDTLLGKASLTNEKSLNDDPGLYRIERARRNMSEADKDRMMKLLEISFHKFFSDDYKDDDIDE